MDYYDIDEIIKTASTGVIDISPSDRKEWAMFCCALKVLGYNVNTFVAMSNTTETECRKVWNAEKAPNRYIPTEDKAKAKIVALAKAAGMNLTPYKIQTAVKLQTAVNSGNSGKQRYSAVTAVNGVNDFDGIEIPRTPRQPTFITLDEVSQMESKAEQSTLFNFLCRLFPVDEVRRVFRIYRIGATKEFNTTSPALASAFPYINTVGDCIDVHLMPYDPDGHRRKFGYSQNWLLAKRKQSDRRGEWCLFGEHLLALSPTAPVGIVESEKTALIAALSAPGYVWVATGSLNNLNMVRCAALKDRAIYVFPDADGIEQWRNKSESLRKHGFDIYFCNEYINDYATGEKDDLGDILCRWLEQYHLPGVGND
ncbi:MAG: hypothetical protein K2K70_01265 [Lachnospiraceae bacterium]|nr:hypothetical protein [Lachnospiraceae bacterium]